MKNETRLKKCCEYVELHMNQPARIRSEKQMYVCCETPGAAYSVKSYLEQYGFVEIDHEENFSQVTLTL
jgi:hypothetical protein